jgi:hypothetical protein
MVIPSAMRELESYPATAMAKRLSLSAPVSGYCIGVNDPRTIPTDATKSTEEQRELQNELDHQHDDPDAPGRHQSKDQVADET